MHMQQANHPAATLDTGVRVLILPGWQNSGEQHWQSHWERLYGYERVLQHDWQTPRSGDWMARLEEVILQDERPVALVAHSLGCQLVARWAAHSRHVERVTAALLVAPPDTEALKVQHLLPGWSPIVRQRLPFPALVVASSNDEYCALARAQEMANAWGARFEHIGAKGHINSDSGLDDWHAGHQLLLALVQETGET